MARRSGERPRSGRPLGWRRWAFPVAAATLVPLLLFSFAELALRLAGLGYPAGFFVPVPGQPAEMTNPRFGWRFFPPAIARSPVIERLRRDPEPAPYRIFVLGGSAALGTPEPAFAFGRLLEVLLEERYPATDFELVNAALAASNSHVALEIARDCLRRRADLLAVYLGNNEVVGPYGPGTVFAPGGARLTAIRLGLRLRRLRGGQLLARATAAGRRSAAPARWRGMEMFRERRVAANDPRLDRTYRQLAANLEAIARLAKRAGTPLLLSTVAVDLRDTPPFASRHRDGLTDDELTRWREASNRADRLSAAGRPQEALEALAVALAIDDQHAELRFRAGHLLLRAGSPGEARDHLVSARDLDALRFRADSEINRTIRRVADAAPGTVRLVDAERRLAAAPESRSGLPGNELFWEHVHLRFVGNYRLAEAFLAEIGPLLPEEIRGAAVAGPAAAPPRVAERLALTDRERWRMARTIHRMTRRPPFTGQLAHAARQRAAKQIVLGLRARAAAAGDATLEAYRRALAGRPDDLQLRQLLARALDDRGQTAEAVDVWRQLVERLPEAAPWRTGLGFALAAAGDTAKAIDELRRALSLAPESAEPRINLAATLARAGRREEAERLYHEALALDAASEAAHVNLADLLERDGRRAAAERQLRRLIELDPSSALAHRRLGELYDRQGDAAAAIAAYQEALERDEELAPVHNNLGYLLAAAGRPEEAARQYLAAIADDPALALAYFNLGDLLLGLNRAAAAAEAYRTGLTLEPGNDQARANLEQAERLAAAAPASPPARPAGPGGGSTR